MKKINFEAGTQISPAKVTIDEVEHNVTPAVWEGNTPLSPFVLNKMQSNIENAISESGVIVSATEPTGSDRKKVWLQHSKNLLKPQALKTTTTNGVTFTPIYDDNGALLYINVNGTATANTTYVIAKNTTSLKIPNESFIVNGCPSGGSTSTYGLILTDNVTPYDWDTGNGSTYPANYGTILQIYIASGVTVSNLKFKPMLRLATNTNSDYEPYVEPKIYVLNDNNIYEEFVPQNEIYSTTEQRIGTWIDGKPIYRKVFQGTISNDTSIDTIQITEDIENMIDGKGFVKNTTGHQMPVNSAIGGTNDNNVRVFTHYKHITYLQYGSFFKGGSYSIILEYTKTTD